MMSDFPNFTNVATLAETSVTSAQNCKMNQNKLMKLFLLVVFMLTQVTGMKVDSHEKVEKLLGNLENFLLV